MSAEKGLKPAIVATLAGLVAGIGVLEALDQFGAPPAIAALYPVLPVLAIAAVALRMRGTGFVDIIRGGAFDGRLVGLAAGGMLLSAVVLVGAPMAVAFGGNAGLLLLVALLAGFAIAQFITVPVLRTTGAPTLAAAIGVRFGPGARTVSAIAVVLAMLPLAAAEAALGGAVLSRMLGLDNELPGDLLVWLAAACAILGGIRGAVAVAALSAPIAAAAYLAPVSIVSLDTSPLPMPWIGLLDAAGATEPTRIAPSILLSLAVALLAGAAVLPSLLFPAFAANKRAPRPGDLALGLVIGVAVVLAAPSYAHFGALYGIEAATNPAGLVLNFAEHAGLSSAPSVLLIGGLLAAGIAAMTAALATIGAAFGHDLYGERIERSAPAGRRIFIGRVAMLLAALLIVLSHRAAGGAVAALAFGGLSVAAGSFAPLLAFGRGLRPDRPLPAVAAMTIGLGLVVADAASAVLAPAFSGHYLGMGPVTPTVLGPTGWLGLPVGASGIIGVIAGTIVLAVLDWLPAFDPRRSRKLMRVGLWQLRYRIASLTSRVDGWRRQATTPPITAEGVPALPPPPVQLALPPPSIRLLPPPEEAAGTAEPPRP